MDGEKTEFCCRLWRLGKLTDKLLNDIAANPEGASTLETIADAFQTLHPYVSQKFSERFIYLFSGAEIEPDDLRDAGGKLLDELSVMIGKSLLELLEPCPYVERADAEKLFPLWDEMPHKDVNSYIWMFKLCEKASISMPAEAFRYTLRLFEEQPSLLSSANNGHDGYVYRPSEQRTFECCPICGGNGSPYFRAFAYQMADFSYPHLPAKLWMRCSSCGNLYTWKYPEDKLKYADSEGKIVPDSAGELTATVSTSAGILSVWSDILNRISVYSSGKKLLEVGIGKGELLAVALELGYQPDAVEIAPGAAHEVADMLGIPIWCGDFLHYDPETTYSVITIGDVIEHVTDPGKALRNAHRLLADDGALWLSTPNFESSFSRMLKFKDPMWMEPYHISYFNRTGLEELASECGFDLREYRVSSRYNGSMEMIFTKKKTV